MISLLSVSAAEGCVTEADTSNNLSLHLLLCVYITKQHRTDELHADKHGLHAFLESVSNVER